MENKQTRGRLVFHFVDEPGRPRPDVIVQAEGSVSIVDALLTMAEMLNQTINRNRSGEYVCKKTDDVSYFEESRQTTKEILNGFIKMSHERSETQAGMLCGLTEDIVFSRIMEMAQRAMYSEVGDA